jgi:hypothetical protein
MTVTEIEARGGSWAVEQARAALAILDCPEGIELTRAVVKKMAEKRYLLEVDALGCLRFKSAVGESAPEQCYVKSPRHEVGAAIATCRAALLALAQSS